MDSYLFASLSFLKVPSSATVFGVICMDICHHDNVVQTEDSGDNGANHALVAPSMGI